MGQWNFVTKNCSSHSLARHSSDTCITALFHTFLSRTTCCIISPFIHITSKAVKHLSLISFLGERLFAFLITLSRHVVPINFQFLFLNGGKIENVCDFIEDHTVP